LFFLLLDGVGAGMISQQGDHVKCRLIEHVVAPTFHTRVTKPCQGDRKGRPYISRIRVTKP